MNTKSFKKAIVLGLALSLIAFFFLECKEASSKKMDAEALSLSQKNLDTSNQEKRDYLIDLVSRKFIPPEGINKETLAYLNEAIKTKKILPHIIIQFYQSPLINELNAWKPRGLNLLDYIGGEAWFATLTNTNILSFTDKRAVAKNLILSAIRWIGIPSYDDKIHPYIKSKGPGEWAKTEDGQIKVAVEFYRDIGHLGAKRILQSYKAIIEQESAKRISFYIIINPANLETLAKEDSVKFIDVYPPPKIVFNDGSRAWTRTDLVQSRGILGNNVILGIWDENEVDAAHNDLGTRVVFGESTRTNVTSQHSTHVAGTMAGNGTVNNRLRGHAPQAQAIVSYDFFGNVPNEMTDAISSHRIGLANNSWGYLIGWFVDPIIGGWVFSNNQSLFGNYLGDCYDFDGIVRSDGLILVFAVGNDRDNPTNNALVSATQPGDWDQGSGNNGYSTIAPPATAKNIISVGAIDDTTGNMTVFSNWGPTDDGRIKPDLVAPGLWIRSCDDDANDGAAGDLNNGYVALPGTSMAAPAISGIGALLVQDYRIQYFGSQETTLSPLPSTIKALLIHSAQDLGNIGPDYTFGWGGVDAQAAANLIENHLAVEGKLNGHTGHISDVYATLVPEGQRELRVTLVWDDVPQARLQNNLDLEIESPAGEVHYPWILDPANPARPATRGIDRTNNVEQVHVENPIPGPWKIKVKWERAKYPDQTYSLVSDLQIGPPSTRYQYAAKFIYGSKDNIRYQTLVNIHNPNTGVTRFIKRLALAFPPGEQFPGLARMISFDGLGPNQALLTDGIDVEKRLFPLGLPARYIDGFILIQSENPLDVSTVYEAIDSSGSVKSFDVEQIKERRPEELQLPDLIPVPYPDGSYGKITTIQESGVYGVHGVVTIKVRNIGTRACGPFLVKAGPSENGWGVPDYFITVSGLDKNEEKEIIAWEWGNTIPGYAIPIYYFDIVIDVDTQDKIIELNEENNKASGPIR